MKNEFFTNKVAGNKNLQPMLLAGSVFLFLIGVILGNLGVPAVSGTLLCIAFICAYVWFLFQVLTRTGARSFWKGFDQKEKNAIYIMYIISNFILVAVLVAQRYIHFWDYSFYWANAIEYARSFFTDPIFTIQDAYETVNTIEYNYFIPCFLALPMKIFGEHFTIFALLVYNMFLVPAFFILLNCIVKLMHRIQHYEVKYVKYIAFIILLCVPVYVPILNAFSDAFAFALLACAFLLFYDGYLDSFDWKKDVLLGASLVLTMLGRRYFAFAVVGFAVALVFYCIVRISKSQTKKESFQIYLKNGLVIGAVVLIPLCLFFRGFIELSISGNKAVAYSGYQFGDYIENYKYLIQYFGLLYLVFIIPVVLFVKKGKEIGLDIITTVVFFFATSIQFYRIQSMMMQHYYIVTIPILVLLLLGMFQLFSCKHRIVFFIGLCVLSVNMLVSFDKVKVPDAVSDCFTNASLAPTIRNDIPQIQKLTDQLNEFGEQGNKVYVIASSYQLNDDIIRCTYLPEKLDAVENLCGTFHVDLRDGINTDLFDAEIVVVTDPVQLHLTDGSQRIISLFTEQFQNNTGIAKNFKALDSYQLDDGITATVYQKVSEITKEQLKELEDTFDEYYSDYPELFHNRFEDFIVNK